MKKLRKWSRILHRDIGFFFVGATIIYGISGIALNHMKDWDPNYIVDIKKLITDKDLSQEHITKEKILNLLEKFDAEDQYKSYNFVEGGDILRIYLIGRSSVTVRPSTGEVMAEFVNKRPVFYESNYLHYNPNRWWTWFSDIFAGALILFAITSLFMVRGKKGAWGRGGIYIVLGIIIPILFLIFLS
ncbi:MAG: PepSY-associated TM helix domain-containing protein [Bacteroidales bacterium]|nr:PepSY-associated TM helix domain-containing protein [Bacteroidales bacterium]